VSGSENPTLFRCVGAVGGFRDCTGCWSRPRVFPLWSISCCCISSCAASMPLLSLFLPDGSGADDTRRLLARFTSAPPVVPSIPTKPRPVGELTGFLCTLCVAGPALRSRKLPLARAAFSGSFPLMLGFRAMLTSVWGVLYGALLRAHCGQQMDPMAR
jgi:hypothetical protein